jgi:hypothetical protein
VDIGYVASADRQAKTGVADAASPAEKAQLLAPSGMKSGNSFHPGLAQDSAVKILHREGRLCVCFGGLQLLDLRRSRKLWTGAGLFSLPSLPSVPLLIRIRRTTFRAFWFVLFFFKLVLVPGTSTAVSITAGKEYRRIPAFNLLSVSST